MTRRQLEWIIRVRGTDLSAWPASERAEALDLLRRDGVARLALADALAAEDAPGPDPAALGRIQEILRRGLAPLSAIRRGLGWSALAACAAAGLYLGAAYQPDPAPDLFASAQTVSFAALEP